MFLLVLEFIKCLWELIGLLSDYHNMILDWMGSQQSDRDLNNLTRGHVRHISIHIYAKRSIQIYILIFSFIFLSEIVCSIVRICIQIFVYFSDFFFFYYSYKNCVDVRHGTSDLLPLRRHVPTRCVEPKIPKGCLWHHKQLQGICSWNHYTDSLSSVIDHILRRGESFNSLYSDSQNWVNVWCFWTINWMALNVKHI